MDSVELVKSICKERKIPISRLEKECGFSNGYIRKLKEGKFPTDRIQSIASFLDVSVDYLMTGKEPSLENYPEQAEMLVRIRNDKDLMSAIEKYYTMSDRNKKLVIQMIDALS